MNQQPIFHIILIALICVQLSNNASIDLSEGLYNETDHVVILTADNFKSTIVNSKKAWLVEFYNSWCGFCQRFAPGWKEFATDVKTWQDLVAVAALNCAHEHNYALCREYEIMSYPMLKYYPEGFVEAPKAYGHAMNRGNTVTDHRQDLVQKILSELREGRGKQYPNLQPYIADNLNDIPLNTLLIIQEPDSLLGPELILDFHKNNIKYVISNNTKLLSNLPQDTIPSLYVIGQDKQAVALKLNSRDRKGFQEAIRRNLQIEVEAEENGQIGDARTNLEKVKGMGDAVFQMDLESALRYSLKREVGGTKEISGEKLKALRKYLQVLLGYFPFNQNGKNLLQEILTYANSEETIQGATIGKLVKEAEKVEKQVFSTPQKWLGCQGSSPQYRGYPCGLWTMFHYLTVNVAEYSGLNPRLALEAMHGYIKNFFGCSDCSQHFQDMAKRREIDKVATFDDSILWLWMAHNEVNQRLSGDPSEDPSFPKIQFPSEMACPTCRLQDDWLHTEVLKHLKHMYNNQNIRYLGANTKIAFLGLEANSSAAHAGVQEEAVPVQARSFGQSLKDGNGTSSSMAMVKDKANFRFIIFCVITFVGLTV
ncbi:unnamed protein product [Ceutorhynchus assimilis]|uniref:Sulfhydryl oxidase n=1 Tax=Ceutorhynchus assimilis TaxID=467358 RepID=A0A9N9QJY0_9CUCU|nr:unnamed protein product [Ceutorhynchus assimilis]